MKQFLLIIASAVLVAPVSAAEIGVRHTWGHSTTNIHGGRSVTRSESQGRYHETSRGRATGHGNRSRYSRTESGTFGANTVESYNFGGQTTTGFSETSTFSR